jgi:hypothetical protein
MHGPSSLVRKTPLSTLLRRSYRGLATSMVDLFGQTKEANLPGHQPLPMWCYEITIILSNQRALIVPHKMERWKSIKINLPSAFAPSSMVQTSQPNTGQQLSTCYIPPQPSCSLRYQTNTVQRILWIPTRPQSSQSVWFLRMRESLRKPGRKAG